MPNIEDVMVLVAAHIEQRGGFIETDPGHLIRHLAEEIFEIEIIGAGYLSREYHAVSRALIALEDAGWVEIERHTVGYPRQANKLVSVRLVTD